MLNRMLRSDNSVFWKKAAIEAKLEEEAHRRLIEKKKREFEAIKEREITKMITEVNAKGHVYIDPNEAKSLDLDTIKQVIIAEVSKNKSELESRMEYAMKKLDHTERALRKVELPLLQKEVDKLQETDTANYEAMKKKIVDAAKAEYEARMADRKNLVMVYDDYLKFKEHVSGTKESELAAIRNQKKAELEAAKKARIEEFRKRRYEEAIAGVRKKLQMLKDRSVLKNSLRLPVNKEKSKKLLPRNQLHTLSAQETGNLQVHQALYQRRPFLQIKLNWI